jgi:hypothetical protein
MPEHTDYWRFELFNESTVHASTAHLSDYMKKYTSKFQMSVNAYNFDFEELIAERSCSFFGYS